jgi:BlaI family transcriptional regulator, penicillinase repressor
MAGRKTLTMTERQFQTLKVLWEHGPLTVREFLEYLPADTPYTTALALLQNMEKANLVAAEKDGPAHRYRAVPSAAQATGDLLRDFARRFFGGSARQLAAGLVDAGELTPRDLDELEAKLKAKAKPRKGTP